jgi:tetratricopeptide (TPR) repeat protein
MGDRERAFVSLQTAAKIAEEQGSIAIILGARYLRAWFHFGSEDFERSQEALSGWYAEIRQRSAPFENALFLLLQLRLDLQSGNINQAKTRLDEYESLLPEINRFSRPFYDYQYQLLKAELFLSERRYEEAIAICQNLVEPSLWTLSYNFIYIFNLPPLKDVLARTYAAMGDVDKAIAAYERLITIDPKSNNRFLIHPRYHTCLQRLK